MDGFKERLKHSIQLRLSVWLSVAILAVAITAGVLSYAVTYNEAEEMQDDVLLQVSGLVKHGAALGEMGSTHNDDPESKLFVQYLAATDPNYSSGGTLPLPATLPDGLQTLHLARISYRVAVTSLLDGRRVAVAQETEARDELARDSALGTVLPLLILVLVLLLVVAGLVRKLLSPVARLATEIDGRSEQDLAALPAQGLPSEIRPFVVAINRLLARVALVLESERRFIADAAHEIRSPLTALSLQAERLDGAELSDEARARLTTLRRGIERGRALLEQLLAYARAQSENVLPTESASIKDTLHQALEDMIPLAQAKNIDLGVVRDDEATVAMSSFQLNLVLKNLIDNAIRYSPTGGKIDLAVHAKVYYVIFQVKDSGPGIEIEKRCRVFDPFYRALGSEAAGSGLGLAIVKTIVDRTGAHIALRYADEKNLSGLLVRVKLPRARSRASDSGA